MTDTLCARLGAYDAIVTVTENLLSRLTKDPQLGRFWKNRGDDGVRREKTFIGHLEATLENSKVPASELAAVLAFIDSTKRDIVE